jgi:beta-lactamase superfamily II metal-dependent hydrolase
MLEITALPARQGDAIWIKWGDAESPHQMLIDMGTAATGKAIRERIEALRPERRIFDLIVTTHIDADHIGGVVAGLVDAEPIVGFHGNEIWFNGYQHLEQASHLSEQAVLESMGSVQGERLAKWLYTQQWNTSFSGGPICREIGSAAPSVCFHDGLKLTILGPTRNRLRDLKKTWKKDVSEAIAKGLLPDRVGEGLEVLGSTTPPVLNSEKDLLRLAQFSLTSDTSAANGSSIALLLEYQGRTMVLAGDAFSSDLLNGIRAVSSDNPLQLDVFKLPHHGSKQNVHRELIEAVACHRWLISTDGTQFRHPDPEAVARLIQFSAGPRPKLCFNEPSSFNQWWCNPVWRARFGYSVECGTKDQGITIRYD